MKNIKIGFLMVVGVLLLDSCLVIPRHRTYTERKMYRNGMYIYPHIQLYKKRYTPIVPNYQPQPRQFYNTQKPR